MTTTSECAAFEAALPDYLDGTLADDGAARAHIVSCESCRALVRDMERIRARAAALPALHPPRDLWAGIEARIQTIPQEIAPRRPLATRWLSQRWYGAPLARAAVLVIATASVTLLATHQWSPTPGQSTSPAAPATTPRTGLSTVSNTPAAARTSEFIYDQQISAMRQILDARRDQLDPKTVAIIEKNLRVIDTAIAESRAALARDPANGFLAGQLDASLNTKLELLRTVAMLPART
jgi:Putative zinc-finger